MKQNIVWLALTLLFAIGVTLSMTAGSYRPVATTTEPATTAEKTQPIVTANVTPALPEVPVAPLDDVSPRPSIAPEALARWIVEPGTSPTPRTTETTVPLPPTKQPKGGSAELPGKHLKRTANARACGSASGRFADLMQRLKLAPRCTTRRSAA